MPDNSPFFVTLPNRGLIHLEGDDARDFLQGLITNDVTKAAPGTILYACLLTPQGKFLHDFFLHDTGDAILLDCEGGERAQDLYDRLVRFRLRKKVQISVEMDVPIYVTFDTKEGLPDPRHPDLGHRTFIKPDLPERDFAEWDHRRIELTIPDGSRDLIPDKSTMAEGNMDTLNAIDYEKGCYVGQELTARMHYRGLGKRFLRTVTTNPSLRGGNADAAIQNGTKDTELLRSARNNEMIYVESLDELTDIRSTCGDIGIALVKK